MKHEKPHNRLKSQAQSRAMKTQPLRASITMRSRLLAATAQSRPSSGSWQACRTVPPRTKGARRMQRGMIPIVILIATLGFCLPTTVNAENDEHGAFACDRQKITPQLVDAKGRAHLCVTRRGVTAWMNARNLVPYDAYTVWWVYFDDPTLCEVSGECGGPDFGGTNPLGVFGRMDSAVAPRSGKKHFFGRISGFRPSSGSQIWLWIFGHGPADNSDGRHLARQLLTPELPPAGRPHLGNDIDGPLGFEAAIVKFEVP